MSANTHNQHPRATTRDEFVALVRKLLEEPGQLRVSPATDNTFTVSVDERRPDGVLRATFHGEFAEDRLPPGWEAPDRWKMPRREWDRDVDPNIVVDEILLAAGAATGRAGALAVHVEHRYVDTRDVGGGSIIGCALLPILVVVPALVAAAFALVLGRPLLPTLLGVLVGIVAGIWAGFRLIESAEAQIRKLPRARRERAYSRRFTTGLIASAVVAVAITLAVSRIDL